MEEYSLEYNDPFATMMFPQSETEVVAQVCEGQESGESLRCLLEYPFMKLDSISAKTEDINIIEEPEDYTLRQENYSNEYHQEDINLEEPECIIKQEEYGNEFGYHEFGMKIEQDESYTEMLKESFKEEPVSPESFSDPQYEPKTKKVRGRPRGAKTGTGSRSHTRPRPQLPNDNGTLRERLPKMSPNVISIKLKIEEIEKLKKLDCFFQPGVCCKIAPKLDQCKECRNFLKKSKKQVRLQQFQVDCRFYQFRKLRYVVDDLEVAGFLEPFDDPVEIDRQIWMPNHKKLVFKTLTAQNARFILAHVGMDLCRIIEREKEILEKYKSGEHRKSIIWKRLLDRVTEMCDKCATTLFNYHYICTKCGLSLCIDCAAESEDGVFEISCSMKECFEHHLADLSLTQMIVGECMEELQKMLHETCLLWKIEHECSAMTDNPEIDKETKNLISNLLIEMETGKTIITREFQHPTASVEVDFKKIDMEDFEEVDDFSERFDEFIGKKASRQPVYCHPVKNVTTLKRETVVSIPRSMSQITSNLFYPDVKHRWLCENKLLRLLEPMNPRNEEFFQEQWQRGQPVLISNLMNHLDQALWIPQAFLNEFGQERSDFVNCMNGKLVRDREISSFWEGFESVEKRLVDNDGNPMLLKLKDWPPDSDFKKIMPSRFEDVMKNLPLNAYTNRTGDLNIVKYLPACFIHPDLGPKGYFAYGSPFFLKEGTTNLHLDISDACNVMCYIGFPRDKDKTMDDYVEQGFKAILEADCDLANMNRVIEDGEIPGAIWHIYDSCDADRIRDFLLKIAQERGFEVAPNHDVIHDQNWYLDGELRARLYKEYGVKGYAIVQCLGDCIVLPAGTPHQVRNIYSCIKIAEDFVSPQQVAHCLNLSNQFRKLTKVSPKIKANMNCCIHFSRSTDAYQ